MTTASTALSSAGYRIDAEPLPEAATASMREARDALQLAILALESPPDDSRGSRQVRVNQGRALLVEAVLALARARVHIPGVRTYALPVVLQSEAAPDRESTRLHQLAARLLWHNLPHLPAQDQTEPLTPEDEAQLARLVARLGRRARLDIFVHHRNAFAFGLLVIAAPLAGVSALPAVLLGAVAAYLLLR